VHASIVVMAMWPIGALELSNNEFFGNGVVEQLLRPKAVIFSGASEIYFDFIRLRSFGVNQFISPSQYSTLMVWSH